MTHPTDTARAVLRAPDHFCDRPDVLATAWQILKVARGQAVDPDRTGPPRHLVDRHATPHSICDELRRRIRARAATIGITGPAPLILRRPA